MATTKSPQQRDNDKNPGQDEFDKLIDRNISPGDERMMEERAKEGASEDLLKQSSAEKKETSLLGGLGSDGESFYKKSSGQLKNWRQNKKLLFGLGLGGAVAGGMTLLLFGFLNVFKLDHMMSNIDSKTFARLNGTLDGRSSKYINTYMTLRLADIGDNPNFDKPNDPDNLILRANRVDNNNPLFDWYKTMRTSKFEQEIFEKYGFKFTSVAYRDGNQIKRRPGFIQNKEASIKEFTRLSPDEMDNVLKGNVNELNGKLSKFVEVEAFASDKEGRRAIKRVVNDNTHWSQVFKRRQVRKAIQNMTGVRDWRFFEDKRNKFDEKKIDIRNKIITKAVPPTTKAGKFVNCLFGIAECKMHSDPSSPDNRAEGSLTELRNTPEDEIEVRDQDTGSQVLVDPETAQPTTDTKKGVKPKISLGPATNVARNIAAAAVPGINLLNIVSVLDSFSKVDSAIKSGAISKGVTVARGVQAMSFYQTFATAKDQIKAGEVQGSEVNEFMKVLGPISASEGWSTVIDDGGRGSVGFTGPKVAAAESLSREKYCSEKHQLALETMSPEKQGFAYLCPDKQIGGSNKAASLEKMYNENIGGQVISPILNIYNGVRKAPILGKLVTVANKIIGGISERVTTFALQTLGLDDNVEKVIEKITVRLAGFLGAGPMMNGKEPAGIYSNMLIQGGAYTAESSSRANGAAVTTPDSMAVTKRTLAQYNAESINQRSAFERYLSLSNPESLASKSAFGISQLNGSSVAVYVSRPGDLIKSFASVIVSPFTKFASAQTDDGYKAADFAGIKTYDFPSQCHGLDPLTATPQSGTNIQQILSDKNIPNSELTWELVTNSDEWYSYMYEKLGDDNRADEIAETIYNCHLLDTSIRGSLGYLYGYTNDNGIEESSQVINVGVGTPSETNSGGIVGNVNEPSDKIGCAEGTKDLGVIDAYSEGKKIKMRACAVPNITCSNEECTPGSRYYVKGADRKAIVNARVSGAFYSLAEAARQSGVELSAFSSFRTMAHQTELWNANPDNRYVATPGHSNHQLGIAMDFSGAGNVKTECESNPTALRARANTPVWNWLQGNASKYGIKQYCAESWHWDASGLGNRVP